MARTKRNAKSSTFIPRDTKARITGLLAQEGLSPNTITIGGKLFRGKVPVIMIEVPTAPHALPEKLTDKLLGSFDLHYATAEELPEDIVARAGTGRRNVRNSAPAEPRRGVVFM